MLDITWPCGEVEKTHQHGDVRTYQRSTYRERHQQQAVQRRALLVMVPCWPLQGCCHRSATTTGPC
jgi:hypothetical protein